MTKRHFSRILWLVVTVVLGSGLLWFVTLQRSPVFINSAGTTSSTVSSHTPFPAPTLPLSTPLPTSTPTLLPDLGKYDQEVLIAQLPLTKESLINPFGGNKGCCGISTSGWPGKTQIHRVPLKDSPQLVLEIPFGRTIRPDGMSLSPNSETLGIWMLDHDYPKESDLYQLSLRTGKLLRVPVTADYKTLYFWDGIYWAPDSSRFAFGELVGSGGLTTDVKMGFRDDPKHIHVADSIPLEGIFRRASLPAVWSPDSSRFTVANSFGGGVKNIWLIDREGTQVTSLFNKDLDISIEWPYVWSPDSNYLAFSRPRGQPYQDIYLIDVAKKQVIQVTDFAKSFPQSTSTIARSLTWLPDSRTILFTLALDRKPYRVMSLDVITRQLSVLSDFSPLGFFSSNPKEFDFSAPALILSPNGKTLLVESGGGEVEKNLPLQSQIREYVGIDTLTGRITWQFPNNRYVWNPRWSPDNYFIAAESGGNIYVWNVMTGKEIQLTNSKGDAVNYLLGWIPKTSPLISTPTPSKTP